MAPNRMFQQLTDKTEKKKHRPFYEAVDMHARRRLKIEHGPFCEFNYVQFCSETKQNS